MWRIPVSLMAGGNDEVINITADEYIGNLYLYMGSPSAAVNLVMTIDGADVGVIQIPADFNGGSTFTFVCINGGRILGTGGAGGKGGNDFGPTGTSGVGGSIGQYAILSDGFAVDLDIDDGFLFGGGGGGGGGSFDDQGASGTPGGGGGGGAGWGFGFGLGGAAGDPTGFPVADPGMDGSNVQGGAGGEGGTTGVNDGGNGGDFGEGGITGDWAAASPFNTTERGGTGGQAGNAFRSINGAVLTFNGGQTEEQLRTSGRILGEVGAQIRVPNGFTVFGSSMAPFTLQWQFGSDTNGTLSSFSSISGSTPYTIYWADGPVIDPSLYEVRVIPSTEFGSWDNEPGAAGTWFSLSSARSWSIFDSAFRNVGAVFEIRSVATGASGILESGLLQVDMEDGS